MIGYKLFHIRRNGELGPLFINRKQVIPLNKRLKAESHRTPNYAFRIGWHICSEPNAPHIKLDCKAQKRAWYKVEFSNYEELQRPKSQGGLWFIAKYMRIVTKLNNKE